MSYQRDTPHEHIAHASTVETIKNTLEIAHTVSQPTPRAWSRACSALCPRPAAHPGHAQHHESTCSSATPRQPQHHLPAPQQQTPPQQPLQDAHEIPSHPHGERRTRTADTTIFSRVLYQLSYLAASRLRRLRCYRLEAPAFCVPSASTGASGPMLQGRAAGRSGARRLSASHRPTSRSVGAVRWHRPSARRGKGAARGSRPGPR